MLQAMSVSIDDIPQPARMAWLRLRDELHGVLGDDLVAIWAYGGTTSVDGPPRSGDLDTYVIVKREPDDEAIRRIEDAHEEIARAHGIEWDARYILVEDARRAEDPRHAYRSGGRDTSWAVNRAHWLAGRYVQLYGPVPAEIVPPPTWPELEDDLRRELEHLERHVVEGDTDPFEATYAILNGSRILHALDTGSVAISKRAAGAWALEHLPARWHPALHAAGRAYEGQASPDDVALLATDMAPFVAMVRQRLPAPDGSPQTPPRWSGAD
jgi:hypothetical protein